MANLTGKRILILGSSLLIAQIVQKAKSLGIYTVVVDNRPYENAPAKHIADKFYNESFADTEIMKEIIEKEKIDGVYTGFTDSYIEHYIKICDATGLPCYGTPQQFDIAIDKASFKKACIESGVPVIPGGIADSFEEAEKLADRIGLPLMLKPVDNSGSRGVIRCNTPEELQTAYDYALSFSAKKSVIVEKYMVCENFAASYFMANGLIRLSSTDDRYMFVDKNSGSSASSYSVYPSKYTERYINEVNDRVIHMLRNNGFKEGMLSLQAFVDKDSFYFCEMCYRPSGGQHYQLTQDNCGIDQLALALEYAVTGDCSDSWNDTLESPFFKNKYIALRILGKEGERISTLEGAESLRNDPSVVYYHFQKQAGDEIGKPGTTAQKIGDIIYKIKLDDDEAKIADSMFGRLHILNDKGENIAFISLPY